MRLFAGLLPPPPVRDELAHALEPHRDGWPGLRWLSPVNWHVTLSFFGEVPDPVLPELRVRLGRAAARHAPLTVSFAGGGAFPSPRRARVFWTGLTGDRLPLTRLADSVAAGGRRAGIERAESRRFAPHLSLARSRADTDLRPLVEAFETFAGTPWQVDAVHLVRSHLGATVRYETVAEWPLTARAPRGQS
ncbi:2'-5' RNA ligase [Streptosporangium becharense]|uniref:RNA 2',3'-cyclic phosphodiesterase n=1 Tax=Streptosporangium becharense TaxID=1816182 RepID=A0A7W9IIF0_9ACTN|nr:RNA 2',3'-cyclic phosphodiesterase [Streptosporangium becharense]MBB2914733.1 2'-5' RNA ligase [Streptosporangium becharense]MBB5820866.1 2'-5' RNA ligase [Streptosporangium becharense]